MTPRPLVLDSSVTVKWYLREEHSKEALTLLEMAVHGHCEFLAPSSLPTELFNTFWQRYRRQSLTKNEVKQLWSDFSSSTPLTLYDPADLIDRAAELVLETEIIIYDALFVALAEYSRTVMITADRQLLRTLGDTHYSGLVTPLTGASRLFR